MKRTSLLLCLSFSLGCEGHASQAQVALGEQEVTFERPEEVSPKLLRSAGSVFTVRRTGEFSRSAQVSLFEADDIAQGVLVFETGGSEENWEPTMQRLSFDSQSCPALNAALGFFRAQVQPSHLLSDNFYAPSVHYQVWATSLNESRHYVFSAPDPTADGVAVWGDSDHPSAVYLESLDQLIEQLLACIPEAV